MARLVTGVFWDRAAAERAYQALRSRGYNEAEVNVMMSAATRQRFFDDDGAGNGAGEQGAGRRGVGAGVGAVAGGVIACARGGGRGGRARMGLVLAGPMAAALAGAGAGGVTGVIGALIGAGIPEDRAHLYRARPRRAAES